MQEKVVCYHKNDSDGKMAAGVVATVHPHAEFPRKRNFYKIDRQGVYYIPEVEERRIK